jgi:hypothetical protein
LGYAILTRYGLFPAPSRFGINHLGGGTDLDQGGLVGGARDGPRWYHRDRHTHLKPRADGVLDLTSQGWVPLLCHRRAGLDLDRDGRVEPDLRGAVLPDPEMGLQLRASRAGAGPTPARTAADRPACAHAWWRNPGRPPIWQLPQRPQVLRALVVPGESLRNSCRMREGASPCSARFLACDGQRQPEQGPQAPTVASQ